jgi:hypothetical protein
MAQLLFALGIVLSEPIHIGRNELGIGKFATERQGWEKPVGLGQEIVEGNAVNRTIGTRPRPRGRDALFLGATVWLVISFNTYFLPRRSHLNRDRKSSYLHLGCNNDHPNQCPHITGH